MNLDAHWMPFTANKAFKQQPKMLNSADGMYWRTNDQREILDMTAGLWCTNLGHGRVKVAEAMYKSAKKLDYAPSFSFGHDGAFELATRLSDLAPLNLNKVFFTSSGSESVDTAIKMALAYHVANGEPGRKMIISRERGYHGVNLGGTAAGGLPYNTRTFGRWGQIDLMSCPLDIENSAFSRGLPKFGAEKADELEHIINLHGAENIAAVIVEPIAGAGGVIVPPQGYLKRLREIATQHGVLLIFDEVVCAFGRTGSFTASEQFDVLPDLFTTAKGLTSGMIPMGAVFCTDTIHDVIIDSTQGIEFFHGYTYSAHPTACAAAMACLDIYQEEGLFTRAREGIGLYLEQILHSMKDLPGIIDIRNYGLLGAIEFEPQRQDKVPLGVQVFNHAWNNGVMVRGLGNSIVVSPPLVIEESHVDEFSEKIWKSIKACG